MKLEDLSDQLSALISWCCRSVNCAPEGTPGYRDLYYNKMKSRYEWHYPWSNSAERIEVLLWASGKKNGALAEGCAWRYADTMLQGGRRGILLEKGHPADGMVAYWSEVDAYMTNYTMRVPSAFLAAAEHFKDGRFEHAAYRSAYALLRFQNEDGVLQCGYSASRHQSVTEGSINSRCFYSAHTFAAMAAHDGASRWENALGKLTYAIQREQRDDGSFPDQIPCVAGTDDGRHKGHFHAYILYGLSKAIIALPDWEPLRNAAKKLAYYCIDQINTFGSHVYGSHISDSLEEAHVWKSPVPDLAAGLAWLAVAEDNIEYATISYTLVKSAFHKQANRNGHPDTHGAIPIYSKSSYDQERAEYGGFYSFWTLLAVMGLEKIKMFKQITQSHQITSAIATKS